MRFTLGVAITVTALAQPPLTIGPERQLFVDDYLIASTNLRRVIHPVEKYPDNPILLPVKPWEGQYTLLYGTVMRDEEEGIWKAWYLTMHHFRYIQNIFPESTYLCYATSRDGIRWEKPALGLIEYRGSKENNIVLEAHHDEQRQVSGILDTVAVLKDNRDPDPARRYKMMIWHHNQRLVDGKWVYQREEPYPMGYYVAFSPDGLRWKEHPKPVFTYDPVRDTMSLMWDPRSNKYVAFVKQHVAGKRARFISESDDFLHWSTPRLMLAADEQDPPAVELYNNTGFYYEGMYLGLLTVFHPEPKDNVYLDIQLISSRDGRRWERVGDRTPFIPAGRRNIDWDFGFQSPSSGPPVRVGDELWFYYSGRCYRHPVPGQGREPNHGAIGLAKLRLDGFVSMDAGEQEGTLVTKPLQPAGTHLFVNADASRGELRAEVLGEDGKPLPGFAVADSIPLRANTVRQLMIWKNASAIPRERTVRLKFYLRRASLYSFAIDVPRGAAAVPPELPVASNPDFLLNRRTADRLAARYPWIPRPLYYGGPETVGPLDVDWVWPDLALVDWDRDGLLDVISNLSAGTYSHRPREQQFRTLVFRNSGRRKDGVPIFEEPYQVDLGFPVGSMAFGDVDNDGALDLIVWGRNVFRWYRDVSKSGQRRFEFVSNLEDYGQHKDLALLESVSMSPSLQLFDWDGDGKQDLIVGGRGGNINYYPRREMELGRGGFVDGAWIGGDRNGSVVFHKNLGLRNGRLCFSTGQRLAAGEDERAVSYYDTATAAVTDFNDDGRPDLVVASFDNLFWFPNAGGRPPRLGSGRRIPVAGGERLPWERLLVIEANWSESDRHNLILQGSSFPWYLPNTGGKGAPRFDSIQVLLQKHAPVGAGDFAIAAAGDLNRDGKPDLVIGNEDGYLLYVQNSSPGAEPESFLPAGELKAGGEVFRIQSGHGLQGPAEARWGYTIPVLADWDRDGDLDLIVGSLHSYYVYLENRGGLTFAAPEILRQGSKPLAVAWRSRPAVHDYDGDGMPDLLALDPEGMLTVFRRTGRIELAPGERILDERGAPIKLDGKGRESGRAMLALMDWDEDGRLDLIVGNAVENFDGLRWYRNVGSDRKWVLARQPNIPLNLPWNHYHQLEPVDWNGDGKTDLIAGSEGGWVYYYRRQ